MPNRTRVNCSKCNARYMVDPKHGGRLGRCSQCDERFILPIPCPEQLIEWAKSATWRRLTRFIEMRGARGHDLDVIDELVEITNQRRWEEENRTYREQYGQSMSQRERTWAKSERKLERKYLLNDLLKMDPAEFESLVADIFSAQGLKAMAVGRSCDDGIDVKVWDERGDLWAIAQCKRYAEDNRISANQIREFAGSYLMSGATQGFFFTTSSYTRGAKKTARGFPWLKLYNGHDFTEYIRRLKVEFNMCDSGSTLGDKSKL